MHYTFRVRRQITACKTATASLCNMGASTFSFSFGFVFFIKRKDEQSKRGWTQNSFVVLSNLNLVSFFYRITELLYEHGQLTDNIDFLEQLFV